MSRSGNPYLPHRPQSPRNAYRANPRDQEPSASSLRQAAPKLDGHADSPRGAQPRCRSICVIMLVMRDGNKCNLSEDLKRRARDAHKTFASAIDPFLQAQFTSDGFPDRLCHYTDFGGLKGILETGSLWATYSRTMNDASEQEYGEKVVRDYLASLSGGSTDDRLLIAMKQSSQRNFATCFCEDSRVLSMWIAYAARGGGYCLEFDGARGLLRCSFAGFDTRLPFRMTYGEALPQHVQSVLRSARRFAQEGDIEASVSAAWANILALKFKHPAFRQENEWRIVIPDPPVSALKFRAGHADVKPYIELSLAPTDGRLRLPLRRVIFGPTLRNDEVLIETIELMLERYGYEGIPVETSGIPYRN
jgi:Protein of unknown function (DUF2971)